MTLKELLNQALSECGFGEYDAFFSSSRPDAKQVLALAKREINDLAKHNWQALTRTHAITMSASTEYALPSDYRHIVADTTFTPTHESEFGVTPDKWAYYEVRGLTNGLRLRMRIIEDKIEIQNPQDGETVRFEYISNHPVMDADATTTKANFEADNDTVRLSDDLFIMGVVWRFRRLKGMEWESYLAEYNAMKRRDIATDKGVRSINLIGEDIPPFEPHLETYV